MVRTVSYQALVKGARMDGAKILEYVKVTGIRAEQLTRAGLKTVTGVSTDQGDIACEYLVNCAGMWAREIGEIVGVSIPLQAAEHMHMATNPIEGTYKGMPYLRDMSGYIYVKEEMGGLLLGGFETVACPGPAISGSYARRLRPTVGPSYVFVVTTNEPEKHLVFRLKTYISHL